LCPQFDSGSCHHSFQGAQKAPFPFMRYSLKNIRIPVVDEQNLHLAVLQLLKQSSVQSEDISISRRALDTRRKNHPVYVYTLDIDSELKLINYPDLIPYTEPIEETYPQVRLTDKQPLIIGMGPAGLFCALAMVEKGLKPIIFDRGSKLAERSVSVEKFWKNGELDTESNVQFGEGGAGAFSDGKLTSRSHNNTIRVVYDLLINFGAPDSIRWEALPHLGTDGIRSIVARIRDYLAANGCTFHYNSKMEDISVQNGRITEIKIQGDRYCPEILVLATGNGSRDTYKLLSERSIDLEPKPFAVGFRVTHPQRWINGSVYGNEEWSDKLGAAAYRLTSNKSGKGTYTFCMCPGGFVIAASSEPETMVTNGMSYSKRDNLYGNSAVVTIVDSSDYGIGLFDGMKYQENLEQRAFLTGYAVPYQTAEDFMQDRLSTLQKISYIAPAIKARRFTEIFPAGINSSIRHALKHFDDVLPGFINNGFLLAPETRTSSPIRVVRDKVNLNCKNISNLYSVGEGAGYSGGIISSAADGYKTGSLFYL
jgi:uncharacterized FAD-dependent dehydrogenase